MEIRRHRAGVVRRGIACVVGALVVLAVGTGAAHASTESVADPAHDNGLGFDPRGDIVQISVTNDPFEVDLMLQSATFEDPSTSADWLGGGATIVFGVDVDGDQQADFLVTYSNNGFGPYVLVASQSTNSLVCGGTPLWDASASTYTAVIDASCFANASGMAVNASFDYYDENWTESFDGTSYTAPASLPTTTTTSTTTTTTTT
ncbi:MAG TPA: hypothetical protein VFR41_05585, partial [Acidimicrobiia bacterium]|nr:hypothetical protein [Acidimicrobiia bacterium]